MAAFGTENPYNAVMSLEGYPDVVIRSVEDILRHGDGRVSADVTVLFGVTQVYRLRAIFVPEGDTLLLDEEIPLPFDNADVTIGTTLDDAGIMITPASAPSGSLIAFDVANNLATPAHVLVIRLPNAFGGTDPQQDPGVVSESAYIGGVLVPPGGRETFAVADLSQGTYTVLALLEDTRGELEVPPGAVSSLEIE
jgi:hypothetical protein